MKTTMQEKRIISLSGLGIYFAVLYWDKGLNDFIFNDFNNISLFYHFIFSSY